MSVRSRRIALLGATGHIGKGLICNFCQTEIENIFLFVRSKERLESFLTQINCKHSFQIKDFNEFYNCDYDIVINCVGLGTPSKVKKAGSEVFRLTENFDNMILEYLTRHPDTLYINFSSGAVYGTGFAIPAGSSTYSKWNINNIDESNYYGIAKLNSEAKHRALKNFNVVDLRVFGYFSRFIDLDPKFLLCEIISCVKTNRNFITDPKNITRDYVHPKDLFSLVKKCMIKKNINDVFDVYSQKPATKFEILNYFKKNYGLKYIIDRNINVASVTGTTSNYYSISRKAEKIGYKPQFTSMECIIQETKEILKKWKKN